MSTFHCIISNLILITVIFTTDINSIDRTNGVLLSIFFAIYAIQEKNNNS